MVRISHQWLQELIDLKESPEEIREILTHLGFEVEEIVSVAGVPEKVVAGYTLAVEPHPTADKLKIVSVALDGEIKKIICGAPNVDFGQWVPVALQGALLKEFTVSPRTIRGVESDAVICSERELGRTEDHSGIWILGTQDIGEWTAGEPLHTRITNDSIFELEVTLNRSDCLSHLGIARELSAKLNRPLHLLPTPIQELNVPASHEVSVQLDDSIGCPRYRARIMKDVSANLVAPFWMRERLKWMGTRAINAVVDVTNYVLFETGHPLHAFDREFLSGNVIGTRKAKPNETYFTLDNEERNLTESDVLIRDAEKAVALGGIMGGLNSEIRESTRNILIEAAYFDPITIRKTARRLGISSESSKRFERGADINGVEYALERAASLIQMLCGGELYFGVTESYPKILNRNQVALREKRLHSILGYSSIALSEATELLKRLQFQVSHSNKEDVQLVPPTWRHDIQQEIDCIEEVGRLKGYEQIPTNSNAHIPLTNPQNEHWLARNRWNDWLRQFGLTEIVSNSMVDPQDLQILGILDGAIEISNPIAQELSVLRTNLIVSLVKAASHNIRHGRKNVALFEIGKVFGKGLIPSPTNERFHIGIALSGDVESEWWYNSKPRTYSVSDVLGILERTSQLNLSLESKPVESFGVLEETFVLYHKDSVVGYAGKLNGAVRKEKLSSQARVVAKHFELDQPIWVVELNTEFIPTNLSLQQYQPFSRFPAVERDLSYLVPESFVAGRLIDAAREAIMKFPLQISISLFDRHHDEKNSTISLGLRIKIQSHEKTLSEQEINEVVVHVISQIGKFDGVKLRSA